MTERLRGALLALATCGCSAAPLLPPAVPDQTEPATAEVEDVAARDRTEVDASPIPLDLARLQFEVRGLPLASERVRASGETMRIASDLSKVSMVLATGLIAEIQIGVTRLYTESTASPFGPTTRARPAQAAFQGLCRELGAAPVRWRGFRADTVTDEAMDFVDYHGSYDARQCRAVAASRRASKAVALIPGVLYAFRTCLDNCEDEPAFPRRESVTLIAPPAPLLLESRAELDDVTNPHVGTFSISEMEVAADVIGTVSMNLPLQAFADSGSVDPKRLLGAAGVRLDVEVRGAPAPAGGAINVFISAFQAKHEAADSQDALSREALGQPFRPGGTP